MMSTADWRWRHSACEKGWIRTAPSRGADGTKEVSLTPKGRVMLDDFESRCAGACSGSGAAKSTQPNRKKSRRRLAEEAKAQSGNLMDALGPGETETPDESGGIG